MKRTKIYAQDILNIILEHKYYDTKEFKYDYLTKKILYKNEEFQPKLQSIHFKIAFDYIFSF